MVGKEPRPSVHVPVSSPLTQHQSYIPYMHGYSYSQSYDPNHPSYRAMPTVMMQNYPGRELQHSLLHPWARGHVPPTPCCPGCPDRLFSSPGSYLPSSYSFSPYGSKASGSEDGDKSRASPSVSCKSSSESKALDILQQHASHYKSKSPTVRLGRGCLCPAPCTSCGMRSGSCYQPLPALPAAAGDLGPWCSLSWGGQAQAVGKAGPEKHWVCPRTCSDQGTLVLSLGVGEWAVGVVSIPPQCRVTKPCWAELGGGTWRW